MTWNIKTLGACSVTSPQVDRFPLDESAFISNEQRVLYDVYIDVNSQKNITSEKSFEIAGPRKKIYFIPDEIRSAIVTCGGLCPGLNDVIRSIVMTSFYNYGSEDILGIPYGYNGLNPKKNYNPIQLIPDLVEDIHMEGGTMLASSRGGADDIELLINTLQDLKVNVLYTIGGDGTQRGAHAISQKATELGYPLSVVGVPLTIVNDISFIQRSFGFETAFSEAVNAITSAHVEAKGAPNGIGLVKLMGRHSGFIAANASLAMNDVNFLLVPEVAFDLYGSNGFLSHLEKRMKEKDHAVICVAEGAGQDILKDDTVEKDASGNTKLEDVGVFLKKKINDYFSERDLEVNVKYIDPSYMIRSAPANPNDSLFCQQLGQFAVHAAMAGKTDMVIGTWNNVYTHVPIELAVSKRKKLDPKSRFWYDVLNATGQPASMKN
jgi:6-phosphofructokinase 1